MLGAEILFLFHPVSFFNYFLYFISSFILIKIIAPILSLSNAEITKAKDWDICQVFKIYLAIAFL